MYSILLFAQRRNGDLTRFLTENPQIGSVVFGLMGVASLCIGIYGFQTGKAFGEIYFEEIRGVGAIFLNTISVIGGIGLLIWAISLAFK